MFLNKQNKIFDKLKNKYIIHEDPPLWITDAQKEQEALQELKKQNADNQQELDRQQEVRDRLLEEIDNQKNSAVSTKSN
jgi:protease II